MARTPNRIIGKLRLGQEPQSERTDADRAYLLWQTAYHAHGAEWAWRHLGIRPASI